MVVGVELNGCSRFVFAEGVSPAYSNSVKILDSDVLVYGMYNLGFRVRTASNVWFLPTFMLYYVLVIVTTVRSLALENCVC